MTWDAFLTGLREHEHERERVLGLHGLPRLPDGLRPLQELGRGGMGVVVEAEDLALGRRVAVKVCRPTRHSAATATRLRHEAQALARLQLPGVLTIHDAIEHAGILYVVTERLHGPTLDTLLAHGPLPPPRACRLIADLARTVHAVHQAGLVHRDIKPANVILQDDTPVLMDFGLARDLDPDAPHLTATGEVLGTPGFMAPEQALARPTDPRTDVYALGATLFALLTGRPPFLADTALATLTAILTTPPPTPPHASPRLRRLLRRALAKSPDRRHPSSLAFAHDLERALHPSPTRLLWLTPVLALPLWLSLRTPDPTPTPPPTHTPTTPATPTPEPETPLAHTVSHPGCRGVTAAHDLFTYDDHRVRRWSTDDGSLLDTWTDPTLPLDTLSVTPDGAHLLWAGDDRARILHTHDGSTLDLPWSIRCSAADAHGFVVGADPEVLRLDPTSGAHTPLFQLADHEEALQIATRDLWLAVTVDRQTDGPHTWFLRTRSPQGVLRGTELDAAPTALAFDAAGRLYVGGTFGVIRVYDPADLNTFTELRRPLLDGIPERAHPGTVSGIAPLPDGRVVSVSGLALHPSLGLWNDLAVWRDGAFLGSTFRTQQARYRAVHANARWVAVHRDPDEVLLRPTETLLD